MLGVTVLIIDEVLARRQRKERSVSVAVQAVIVYGQARHSYEAVMAAVVAGSDRGAGDGVVAEQGAQVDASDEVRILASMILIASPVLFDDPEARLFLEDVQRLAATMYGALSLRKISPEPPTGDGDDTLVRLRAGRSKMDAHALSSCCPVSGQGQGSTRGPRRETARSRPGARRNSSVGRPPSSLRGYGSS